MRGTLRKKYVRKKITNSGTFTTLGEKEGECQKVESSRGAIEKKKRIRKHA